MGKLKDADKKFLLELARRAISHYFKTGKVLDIPPDEVPSEDLVEEGACFVTLYLEENLRGCIGTLEANRPLFIDCINNALASAFEDYRFSPLERSELEKTTISISVLTKPVRFNGSGEALFKALKPGVHGLIIQRGVARATFLPAVWEQLPNKEGFLKHLCLKAGMNPDAWKENGTEFFLYEAIEFSE